MADAEDATTVTTLQGNSQVYGTATEGTLGNVTIYGLGAGTYKLVEIDAPDGYSLPANPFYVTITSTFGPAGGMTSLDLQGNTKDNGVVTITRAAADQVNNRVRAAITNVSAAALPSTGGMGTTLFTVGGIVLMAAAVCFLVLNKKKNDR